MRAALAAARTRLSAGLANELTRRIASGSLWSLIIKVTSAGFTYAMLALLARAMSTMEFGRFGFAFSLASFLGVVASLGLHTGILRWLPEYEAQGEQAEARRALRWSTAWSLAAGVAVALAVVLVSAVAPLRGPRAFLFAGALLVVPLVLAEFVGSALRARGSVIWSQLPRDVLWRLAVLLFVAAVLWRGGSMTAVGGLFLVTVVLIMLIMPQFLLLRAEYRAPDTPRWASTSNVRTWRAQSLAYWGTAVIYASTQYVDTVLVGAFVSTDQAGAYFAAARTASLTALMLVASNMVSAPLISSAYYAGDRRRLDQVLRLVALFISLPTLVVVAVILLAGHQLLALFDPAYVSTYPVLVVLVLANAFNGLCGPMGYVLMLTGHGRTNLRIMSVAYATGLALQVVLLATIGVLGAAIGSSAAIVLWNVACRRVALRRVGVDPTVLSLLPGRAKIGPAPDRL